MNIVIPMAGDGTRFANAGYEMPKPFIDVNGVPMIQRVVETLPAAKKVIFICRQEHLDKYPWFSGSLLKLHPHAMVMPIEGLTEGAASTVMLAESFIRNNEELMIANSDQLVQYDYKKFDQLRNDGVDGIIFTFESSHPKWSYVKVENGKVTNVAEKVVISNEATCGIYYFKHGSDYTKAAFRMMNKNIRVNNEFYNAPVYNELIIEEKTIVPFRVNKMDGLGTPEDLEEYLKHA